MHDLLAVRRSALEPICDDYAGSSHVKGIGMELSACFQNFFASLPGTGTTCKPELIVASLATAWRDASVHALSLALAVAFASRSSILIMATWIVIETSVCMVVVLSYATWCLILAVVCGALATAFA